MHNGPARSAIRREFHTKRQTGVRVPLHRHSHRLIPSAGDHGLWTQAREVICSTGHATRMDTLSQSSLTGPAVAQKNAAHTTKGLYPACMPHIFWTEGQSQTGRLVVEETAEIPSYALRRADLPHHAVMITAVSFGSHALYRRWASSNRYRLNPCRIRTRRRRSRTVIVLSADRVCATARAAASARPLHYLSLTTQTESRSRLLMQRHRLQILRRHHCLTFPRCRAMRSS